MPAVGVVGSVGREEVSHARFSGREAGFEIAVRGSQEFEIWQLPLKVPRNEQMIRLVADPDPAQRFVISRA